MANKNKSLTLSTVHKENAKFNDKTVVPIKDGKYEVVVNKNFKKSEIPKLVGEFISITTQLKENSMENIDTKFLFPILLIKHYTNVHFPQDGLELIGYINELINIEVLDDIIKALPEEEVKKANKWFAEMVDNMPQVIDMFLKAEMLKGADVQAVI